MKSVFERENELAKKCLRAGRSQSKGSLPVMDVHGYQWCSNVFTISQRTGPPFYQAKGFNPHMDLQKCCILTS